MKTRLFPNVGVELYDVDINNLNDFEISEIKEIFFNELIILFRNQTIRPKPAAKLAYIFGDIVNANQCVWNTKGIRKHALQQLTPDDWPDDEEFPVQRVTGKKINGVDSGIFGSGVLDWHSNVNGVSWAPGVLLQAVEGVIGTQTSWMDTTKAYADLPDEIKNRCEKVIAKFRYAPDIWAEGLPAWQLEGMIGSNIFRYSTHLVNVSEKGKKGLYFHYLNECTFPSDPELLEILKKHCFQKQYIQTIDWRPGDVHLSHQVLTLHRREQDDAEMLSERILHRYTFNFNKVYKNHRSIYIV